MKLDFEQCTLDVLLVDICQVCVSMYITLFIVSTLLYVILHLTPLRHNAIFA